MRHRVVVSCLAAVALAACSDGGPSDPPDNDPTPSADGAALVIAPSALLLPEEGTTQQLRAYVVDADGDSSLVAATFESSAPAIVSVTASGMATGAGPGSAQIVARSGGLTSAPVLALRARPADGALLVADSQVIGRPTPVDPTAAYGLGWRYRVRLRGVTAPAIGQVVLASGGAPIGGRVVSSGPAGGDTEVVLELVALGDLFQSLSVNQKLSMRNVRPILADYRDAGFHSERLPGGAVRLSARGIRAQYKGNAAQSRTGRARAEQEFPLGPLKCKAEVPPVFVFPVTLETFSFELDPNLEYDIVIENSLPSRVVVRGTIAPRVSANPRVTAAVEIKAECKLELATLPLPIGGPLAQFIGGTVPLGVGLELGAKMSYGPLGFDAFLQSSVTAEFGFDCEATCQVITELSSTPPDRQFLFVYPATLADSRLELALSAFAWAELKVGAGPSTFEFIEPILDSLRFKLVEAKAGIEQKFEVANREAQTSDPAYASNYALKPVFEAKAAADLTAVADLLKINLATLAYAPELAPLARSPHGSLTISPAIVAPGDGSQVGDSATFNVVLTSATYLTGYVVESIEIRRRKTQGSAVTLEPSRPGCTMPAAQGQTGFSCRAAFSVADTGLQTFYAFVNTKLGGASIPALEIALDGKAELRVGGVGITPATATVAPGATQQFTASVMGITNTAVTWSATGGTILANGNTATFTAGTTAGVFAIRATSVQDPTKFAAAVITVTIGSSPPPPSRVVTVIPDSVIVQATEQRFFSATVSPSSMNGVILSATGGTITQTSPWGGQFRAGTTPGTFVVTARSLDDPSQSGTAKVIIIAKVLDSYTGLYCNAPIDQPGCTPNQPVTAAVQGPIVLNGSIYVIFRWNNHSCGELARLVSSSGGATLIGTDALFCNSGVSGDLNTEGSWTGTLSGNMLTITDDHGLYAFSLTQDQ